MPETLLDAAGMKRTLGRMAHEILEANGGAEDLVVVGVLRRGYPIAKRLAFVMTQVEGQTVPCGKLDASGSRDDARESGEDASEIPFEVSGKTVILVDEVIQTGRTIRAAMDALLAYGRPNNVRLAVLIDRGQRELPIQPDYFGWVVDTDPEDYIEVRTDDVDGEDKVLLVASDEKQAVTS